MKPGGGGAKGSAYERHVAKVLTAAYYPDDDGTFQRVYGHPIPVKGTVKNDLKAMRRYNIDGEDQMVIDASWPFSVECKNYKDVKPFFCGLYCKDSALWDWMRQAEEASAGKMPLVVFRLFRTDDVAMINGSTFGQLHGLFGFYKHHYYTAWNQHMPSSHAIHMFLLKEFLEWIDWAVYKASSSPKYVRAIMKESR